MPSQLQRPAPLPLAPHTRPVYPRRGSVDGKSPLDIVRPGFPKPPVSAPAFETTFGHTRTQSYPGGPPLPPSKKRAPALLEVPTRQRRISAPSSPSSSVKEKPWEKAVAMQLHPNGSSSSLAHIPRQPSPLIFTPELYDGHVPVTLLDNKPLPRTASQVSLSPQTSSSHHDLKQSKNQVDWTIQRVDSNSKLSASSRNSSSSKGFGALKSE